jgi:hypothetical protein
MSFQVTEFLVSKKTEQKLTRLETHHFLEAGFLKPGSKRGLIQLEKIFWISFELTIFLSYSQLLIASF